MESNLVKEPLGQGLLCKKDYQKRYRIAGIVIFAMSVLVLAVRIASYYLYDVFENMDEFTSDFIFTVLVQILTLFVMPFLVYKLALRMTTKQVFTFSNFRKTKPINLLLALAIGVLGIIVTIGISFAWQILLMLFGYMPTSSSTILPETFNIGLFLGAILLTAVLPGFCEEFTMRGGFLTAMRSALPIATVIIVSAWAFGLFHQYILQTFYTACFGALMAFITIRTKSIFPAMIIHFINNGLSVYLEYAESYGWFGGGFYDGINNMMSNGQFFTLIIIYALICSLFACLIYMLTKLNPKEITQPIMLDGNPPKSNPIQANALAFNIENATVKRAPLLELDPKIVPKMVFLQTNPFSNTQPLQNEERILFINNRYYLLKNNYMYALREKAPFRPTLADNVFYIGAIVVSVLSTIFTLAWGFIM